MENVLLPILLDGKFQALLVINMIHLSHCHFSLQKWGVYVNRLLLPATCRKDDGVSQCHHVVI